MDVSIIIVNYNTCTMTQDCIDSVFEKTKDVNFEIILVDNASTDESRDHFSKNSKIKYIYNNENLGFGRANNVGYEHAYGKYLFLLNSDTLLINNAVKLFFDYMEKAPEKTVCCGCILVNKDGEFIHSYGNQHTLFNSIQEWAIAGFAKGIQKKFSLQKYDNPKQKKVGEFSVGFVTGADLFIRKNVADTYGLFDKDFFMYYEDAELQKRYQKNGFTSVIIDGPQIIHLVGKSNKKASLAKHKMILSSLFLYMRKSKSLLGYKIFVHVFKLFYIIRQIYEGLLKKSNKGHIKMILKLK